MKYISMFSGIEAATVAFHPLGWEAMAFAEIEPFPSAVLAYHYPTIPNVGDITQHNWSQYEGKCDLVIGGPPCQAFSIAGLRRSLEDARGNLSLEYIKAVDAIDPRWIITENVPGWLSTKDNAFGCFLAGLAGESVPLEPPGGRWSNAGCVFGPKRTVAWRVLDAQYFGVAQRRRRVFVVASPRNGGNPIEILFKSEGMRRDTPPSRKKGERITPTVTGGPPFSRTGNERVEAEAMVYRYQNEQVGIVQDTISATLRKESATTDECSVPAYVMECEALAIHPHCIGRKAEAGPQGKEYLSDGSAYTMDSRGVAQAIVMAHGQGNAEIRRDGSPSLTCNHEAPIVVTPINTQIAFRHNALGKRTGLGIGDESDPAFTLQANHHHAVAICTAQTSANGHGIAENVAHTLDGAQGQAVSFAWQSGVGINPSIECAGTLIKNQVMGLYKNFIVRRLTPRECERLQGFPDDYTLVPYRGKPAADGPRYKALGNSMAVPCIFWIGKRIEAVEKVLCR